MMKLKLVSLREIIQKSIINRVIISMIMIFIVPLSQAALDIIQNVKHIKDNVRKTCMSLENFTIGQSLVGNDVGAEMNLSSFNKSQDNIKVIWIKKPYLHNDDSNFRWHFPFNWTYDYNFRKIGDSNFGYFHVTGKISFSEDQMLDFLIQFLILFSISMLIFIFLYPIIKKLPQKLIILPINNLLKLLESKKDCLLEDYKSDTNVIEIREIEEKIIDLLRMVDKRSKNEAIFELSAQVAHDIRSPLATINAVVKETHEIQEQKRIMLRNATQQLNDIANVLLVKYRSSVDASLAENSSSKESEGIAVLLDLIVSEKRLQYKHLPISIEFIVEMDSYGVFAQVVVSDFKRVISNLINNAVEAINGKGEIIIRLSTSETCVDVAISDNGVGMSPELILKVFDGSIASNKKEGSGIGLLSSRKLIESWGGKFDITSELNVGTTVHLSFVLLTPAMWFSSELNFVEKSKVVILDDDQSIHDLWESRFSSEVSHAKLQLIHFYQANDLMNYDMSQLEHACFLCDYELIGQDKTGLDVIEQLHLGAAATLVTSRYDDRDIRSRCAKLGVKILPKNYAAYVPINTSPATQKKLLSTHEGKKIDLVLIDDNRLVTDTWKFSAKSKNKNILTFNSFREAELALRGLDRKTPVYIDSDLGTDIPGEECAKILYEAGFACIYLTTGYEAISFESMYWITGIVGKSPDF